MRIIVLFNLFLVEVKVNALCVVRVLLMVANVSEAVLNFLFVNWENREDLLLGLLRSLIEVSNWLS